MSLNTGSRLTAILAFLILAVFGLSKNVRAQSVSLTCTVALTPIVFGDVDVLPGTSLSTGGTLSISCLNIPVSSASLYVCVALPTRVMAGSSSASLAYDLYGPAPATTSWSNTAPITIPLSNLRLNQTYTMAVPAAILAGQQTVPPGAYNQLVTASATFGTSTCTAGSLLGSTIFSLSSSANVLKSCNVSATNLDFGSVGDLDSVVDGQSSVNLQCTRGTGFAVSLGGGLSGATNPTARLMKAGTLAITYGLYQDAARSMPWGLSATALGGTGTAGTQSVPVYGRVPVQSTPLVGTYSDTVVVSITY